MLLPLLSVVSAWSSDLEALCARAESYPLPAPEAPGEAESASLAGCDSEALYYGIGAQPDPVAARRCAWLERESTDGTLRGDAILMMIYANGRGVPRDDLLAIKLACAMPSAPAEREGRVLHLHRRSQDPQGAAPFDFCDDLTSGYMSGVCSERDERIASLERQKREEAAMARLTPEQKAAYTTLQAAATAFFEARAYNEIDMSGTARNSFYLEELSSQQDELLSMLERLQDPALLPEASPAELKKADKELNAVYGQVMKRAPDWSYGTVDAEGIRATQRLWIPYRDALAAFGVQARPGSTSEAWKAWATRTRTQTLRGLLAD